MVRSRQSLFQHHSSRTSVLQCSAFFMVQLPHPYTTTGKTIALTTQTFVSKLISLLFNMLSRFVMLFILFMGFSKQDYWSGLPFPSPVDHILSELSTVTHPSWVALHGMAHSCIELDKAVVHVIRLVSFLWLWFSLWLLLHHHSAQMRGTVTCYSRNSHHSLGIKVL